MRRILDEAATNGQIRPDPGEERLVFGPFSLAIREGTLARDGEPVPLAPKPFETLLYLARHPQRVVPKADLLAAIWPDTFVTDDVLVQCIVEIRRALGDSARDPKWVQTRPKRGYRFLGQVEVRLEPVPAPVPVAATALDRPAEGGPDGQPASADAREVDAHSSSLPPSGPPGAGNNGTPALAPATASTAPPVPASTPAPDGPDRTTPGWRHRPALLAGAAALAVLVLAGTWVGSSTWLRRDAAALADVGPDASYVADPGSVAVLPVQMVETSGDTAWLRDGLAEIIVSEITNDPTLQVVPRARLLAALRARGVLDPALVPSEAGLAAARDLRVERLVTGSFQRVDQRFTLTARVIDVKAGAVAREVVVRGERRADLLEAVNSLCRDLGVELQRGREVGAAPASETPPPTRSEDAYRAYTEALVAEARGSRADLEFAEWRLGEAIAFDPAFARAYLRMALVQDSRRRWGYGVEDPAPAIRSARKLESRLPERERMLVRGMASRYLDNDPRQAIEQWRTLLKLYPAYAEDAGVPTLVADTQLKLGQWDDLILTTEPHVESAVLTDHERAVLCGLLARAFQRRGEFERATTYATRAVDLWPVREGAAFLRARTQLGRVLVDAGRRDRALEVFRAVASDARADVVNLTDAAWGLYMLGDRSQAKQVVEQALRLDAAHGNAYHLRGWLSLTAGAYDAAASDLREAYERTPIGFGSPDTGVLKGDLAALYYEGVAHQKAGRAAAAEAAWRELIARSREVGRADAADPVVRWQSGYLVALGSARLGLPVELPERLPNDEAQSMIAEARIHAVLGQRTQALEDLRQAVSLGAGDFQHIRDDPNYDLLRTSPEFIRLLQTFGGRRGS